MAHTVSYGMFRQVRLAGRPVGEPEIFLVRAGERLARFGEVRFAFVGQRRRAGHYPAE